jgi:transglutaminase-like putative cysteine protease
MNHRLTVITAVAVLLASLSLSAVIVNDGWLYASIAAVIVVAIAGTLTRLAPVPAAVWATIIALLASAPMLGAGSWWWRAGWLAVGAVTATTVTRARGLPVLGALVTYAGSLLLFLNLAFAAGQSLGLIIPTTRSLRQLGHLASQGWLLRNDAPPVPATRPLELIVAAGVGLVAVIADVIAVRLRSPALAGLPLLVLFCVPVTTTAKFSGIGAAVAFCLAITGYLALLAADGRDRLRLWGRLVTVWQQADVEDHAKGPDTRALAAAGRRIGLAAVCVAVIAPLLIPGLHPHKLFAKHPLNSTGNPVALPDPLVAMRDQLNQRGAESTTVLTYTSSSRTQLPPYLQLYVLNIQDSKGAFTLVPPGAQGEVAVKNGKQLKQPPGLDLAETLVSSVRTNVTISKGVTGYSSKLNFLPVPYAPITISTPGSWHEDNTTLMLYSGSTSSLGGLRYSVTSSEPNPSVSELDAPQTGLPSRITSDYLKGRIADKRALTRIARQATHGAKTAYRRAVRLQDWFRTAGGFRYSLDTAQLTGPDSLLTFLTKTKAGFCQQFAYGMAMLARLEGIPSRIAVGYTPGTLQANGSWKVTEADAHAWPELYFKNIGWLRFEPTPAGLATGQGDATAPVYGNAPAVAPTGPAPAPGASTAPSVSGSQSPGTAGGLPENVKRAQQVDGEHHDAAVKARHASIAGPVLLALAILVLLGAIAPGLARRVVRQRRWGRASGDADLAHAAWQELRDDMTDYGLASRPSESPRALARRIGTAEGLDEPGRDALNRIASAEERASYASAAEPGHELRTDVGTVRRSIASTVTPGARWRARLLPPSMLVPVRTGAQQALDVFGWMDAAGQHIRHRTRPGSQHAS